jgi:hypothetical protein
LKGPDARFSRGPVVSPKGFPSEPKTLQDRLCAAVDTACADAGRLRSFSPDTRRAMRSRAPVITQAEASARLFSQEAFVRVLAVLCR